MKEIPHFDDTRADFLKQFLSAPERHEGTLRYEEAAGFLFAMTCIPEEIEPSEWLPVILNQDGAETDIDDTALAPAIGALVSLHKRTLDDIVEGICSFPPGISARPEATDNFATDAPLLLWARGFLEGFQWVGNSWPEDLPDVADEELGTLLVILTFFSSREVATDYLKEMEAENQPLETMAEEMVSLMPEAMRRYAELAEEYAAVEEEITNEPIRVEKTGRNDPCPCGSGMKYKKCCGS